VIDVPAKIQDISKKSVELLFSRCSSSAWG
jgi:hypothetical protein